MEVDERFSKVGKDPRYKKIAKTERKVKIDSRFEKMFTDENFHIKYSTDKRGKAIDETELEDLHKFYEIEKNDEVSNKDEVGEVTERDNSKCIEKKNKLKLKRKRKLLATVKGKDIILSKRAKLSAKKKKRKSVESEESNNKSVTKINFDDIRGETLPADYDSDSDAETTKSNELNENDDGNNDEVITHGWGELDENVKCIENAETSRLAVCNCDWDKVGANDLFILFDSFKPVNGMIKTLKIYPSEFGIERMKEEKVSGPKELRETVIDENDCEVNEDGSNFHMEKLREYQLNRLKYYYAVVECDSVETANKLYEELDGKEYEMSATRMDLRFIPDDTTFDHEPKSVASGIAQLKNYEPVSFHNTALQQTTVRLTWDETDTKRVQTTMRQFTKDDIENMDFKDYLASSEDDAEGEEEEITENINKIDGRIATQDQRMKVYRELMQEIEAKEEKNNEKPDMEVSFKTTMDNDTSKQEDESGSEGEASDEDEGGNEDGGSNEDEGSGEEEGSDEGDDIDDDESENEMSDEEDINENVNINDHNGDNRLPSGDNDENPNEGFNDPFFDNASAPNKTKSKSKKKRKKPLHKHEENLSESELKKKNELELLMLDESEDKRHFNLKNILEQEKPKKSRKGKKKRKDEEVDTFNIDVDDPRFSALYSSHLYALDPSEPNFKKTKATEAIIKETQKRRKENECNNENDNDCKLDSKLSGLINSVKSKTLLHNWKKEKKLK